MARAPAPVNAHTPRRTTTTALACRRPPRISPHASTGSPVTSGAVQQPVAPPNAACDEARAPAAGLRRATAAAAAAHQHKPKLGDGRVRRHDVQRALRPRAHTDERPSDMRDPPNNNNSNNNSNNNNNNNNSNNNNNNNNVPRACCPPPPAAAPSRARGPRRVPRGTAALSAAPRTG